MVSLGDRAVAIGRDAKGNTIITGDSNRVFMGAHVTHQCSAASSGANQVRLYSLHSCREDSYPIKVCKQALVVNLCVIQRL